MLAGFGAVAAATAWAPVSPIALTLLTGFAGSMYVACSVTLSAGLLSVTTGTTTGGVTISLTVSCEVPKPKSCLIFLLVADLLDNQFVHKSFVRV